MKKLLWILLVVIVAIVGIVIVSRVNGGNSDMKNEKVLVAYFSATGNTAAVADRLANAIGADLVAIEPEVAYTAEDLDWRNDKSRSSIEMGDRASRPAIANKIDNIDQYDVIFLGFPIWWGREPSIIDTFMESYDFAGKIIVPFATSGSTPTTEEAATNIQALVPDASVSTGKRFENDVSADELKAWAGEWM